MFRSERVDVYTSTGKKVLKTKQQTTAHNKIYIAL